MQIHVGLTQSKVEKKTPVVRIKELSLHLLNQDSYMIFFEFLKNGENKTRVTEIVSEVLRNNFSKVLAKLRCSIVYISQEDVTYCITETGVTINEELFLNQEEDTKVTLHCHHSLQYNPSCKVVLRSPSADTDMLILAASFLENRRTYIDYGNGKLRIGFWLNQINTINENLKKPLIGFHAFTCNDYVSSFFRKGKKACWKTMKKNQKFVDAFN